MSKLRPSSPAVWRVALGLLAVCLLLCACSQQRKSQGAPYKVLIYGHDNESAKAVEAKLTLTFISHLPQRERLLTVERTANEKKAHLARCLVSIDTDSRKHHDTRLHLTTNRWARPQLALHITTPSASHLRHFLATRGDLICQQIEAFEKRQTVADLRHSHERNVEQLMRKQTGHTLWVPKSLNAVKEGKDFIWVAAGESHDALNICLYSYPATGLDAEQLIRMRDSIMKVNIPGELPGTYMQTEREWGPVARPGRCGKAGDGALRPLEHERRCHGRPLRLPGSSRPRQTAGHRGGRIHLRPRQTQTPPPEDGRSHHQHPQLTNLTSTTYDNEQQTYQSGHHTR